MKTFTMLFWLLLVAVPAAAADTAQTNAETQQRLAAAFEELLRAQGLQRSDTAPTEQAAFAIGVDGSAERPELVAAPCVPKWQGDTDLQGKEFRYVAKNRGEWGGTLTAQRDGGRPQTLVEDNIIELVPRGRDLYVFTGLDNGMERGAVYVIENYDEKPRARFMTLLPGMPVLVAPIDHRPELLVVTNLSLTLVNTSVHGGHIEVLMARAGRLPFPNSVLPIGRGHIFIGICGGVAHVKLPWNLPRTGDGVDPIPQIVYWTPVNPESWSHD